MNTIQKHTIKVISLLLLHLVVQFYFANSANAQRQSPNDEFKSEWLSPKLVKEFSSSKNPNSTSSLVNSKKARFVYLIPSDKPYKEEYKVALVDMALHLQDFYQKTLGNNITFDFSVDVHQTSHTASWYQTNSTGGDPSGWFLNNTLNDGFTVTGGFFGDTNNRWNFFIDADLGCGQGSGANGVPPLGGWAVLHANDLRGLTRQGYIPPCAGGPTDNGGIYRWIGGAGHELGHTWDLPHPAGCTGVGQNSGCTGGAFAENSLMWFGVYYYPNTWLINEDKQKLLTGSINAPFFTSTNLSVPKFANFDTDQKADISVWRPSTGVWSILPSTGGTLISTSWGLSSDKLVPGDYDGDRKTDIAVWRPNTGIWYVLKSSNNTLSAQQYGLSSDIPTAEDYDGDLKTDIAVWRPSDGNWYIYRSATNTNLAFHFGSNEDLPVAGDYNGDKRADIAVFRPSENNWYIYNYYTNSFQVINFGAVGDKLVPNDYDGDSKTDIAVWRPGNGTFYLLSSLNGFQAFQWGVSGDIPVSADYDGDGRIDFSVWRPSTTTFYINQSSSNTPQYVSLGQSTDIPVASAFVR